MLRSKALKQLTEEKSSKLYSWWIGSKISGIYYKLSNSITIPLYKIRKMYGWWMNVFRFDYDFDGHALFAIIEYKLIRIKDCLEQGYAIQTDKDMKALDLAIKLAGRLKDDKYEYIAMDRHEAKWGEMKMFFPPSSTGGYYINTSRPNANTPEEIEQEIEDFRAAYMGAEKKMKKEERWLYDILHKYLRNLWD